MTAKKTPANLPVPGKSSVPAAPADVAAFFAKVPAVAAKKSVAAAPQAKAPEAVTPRLVFAMDATASRQPTWNKARQVQGEMFAAMSGRGRVQLASFGGFGFKASRWAEDAAELADDMAAVACVAGNTQIAQVLRHVLKEAKAHRLAAVVYCGDTIEENEGELVALAERCGALGIRIFTFHEIGNPSAEAGFRAIAQASGGAYARFGERSTADDMKPLLGAVAAYAEGGMKALANYATKSGSEGVKLIAQQLKLTDQRGKA